MRVDLKKAKEEAKKEVASEKFDIAKDTYKFKLEQLDNAIKVVVNIERELEELDIEFEDL